MSSSGSTAGKSEQELDVEQLYMIRVCLADGEHQEDPMCVAACWAKGCEKLGSKLRAWEEEHHHLAT